MTTDDLAPIVFRSADELRARVDQVLGHSQWLTIEQDRIDQFAEATGDRQWIHVDPERAKDGPFGATIAHGWLTMHPSGAYLSFTQAGAERFA